MKVKVCLVGDEAVGKTSLVRRFVLDQFDDRYIVTLGAKVSKKSLTMRVNAADSVEFLKASTQLPAEDVDVDMTIWDIMGSKGFRELLREAYFHGAQGLVTVCDVTKAQSLKELRAWVANVFETVGKVPMVIAVNKCDLKDKHVLEAEAIRAEAKALGAPWFYTSAKTGEGVEEAFLALGEAIVGQWVAKATAPHTSS